MGKEREIIKDILDHFMEHNKFNSSIISAENSLAQNLKKIINIM